MKERKLRNCLQAVYNCHILLVFAALALVGNLGSTAKASNPTNGTINPTAGTSVTWAGTLTGVPPAGNGEASCDDTGGQNCDLYTLTVSGNPADWDGIQISIKFNWNLPASDYDMAVFKEDGVNAGFQGVSLTSAPPYDPTVGTSGRGTSTEEEVVISPLNSGTGVYYIRAIYFAADGTSDQYSGSASAFTITNELPASACTVPTFDNYYPPATQDGVPYPRRDSSGEPSIGVNWNTGNVMTMSRLRANRTTFDDSTSPADPVNGVNWVTVPIPTIVTGFDPILFTDSLTGRTIGGELVVAGGTTQGAASDDDFVTQGANFSTGGAVQGFDHQTIGGGPPKVDSSDPILTARQPTTSYPHLFYYASQQIAYGTVATSFDGGLTYGTAVTAYTLAQCNGLHGHIKVAPNGTVYLPNKNCGGKAAVVVSEDNGLNWSVRQIPQSNAGDSDPSVGIGAGNRVYVSYTDSTGAIRVATSDDQGLTWRDDLNLMLGTTPNLITGVFPAVVAGDNDRAAVFFLGTDSNNPNDPIGTDGAAADGSDPDPTDNYKGTWFPYMATTCDGGRSWSVVKADNDPLEPGSENPAQQGVVCRNGTTCPDDGVNDTRNLLDFNDMTVDSRGRLLAVYADGCGSEHPCSSITDNTADRTQNQSIARLTIIRQRGGMRLFSAFDPGGPAAPSLSPPVQIKDEKKGYALSWATPNDGGSPLISYKIYRGLPGGGEDLVAEVDATKNSFVDNRFGIQSRRNIYYRVTAVNKYGESPRNVKFFPNGNTNTNTNFKTNVSDGKSWGE